MTFISGKIYSDLREFKKPILIKESSHVVSSALNIRMKSETNFNVKDKASLKW